MIELLLGLQTPIKNPLIIEPEPITISEPRIELTLEQKLELDITNNINQCDEAIYYISAENASCIAKPIAFVAPIEAPQAVRTKEVATTARVATVSNKSRATSGWYPYGQCTYFVSTQRSVGQWNNASSWTWQAKRDGWSTGTTPLTGAIGQKGNHVVYVTSVNGDGTFNLSEMNYQVPGIITHRTVSSIGWSFIY